MKWNAKRVATILVVAMVLLAACSDTGEVRYTQETGSVQMTKDGQGTDPAQTAEPAQTSKPSGDGTVTLYDYEIEDAVSTNCYQGFKSYLSKLKGTDWVGFQLVDFDGDKVDELVATRQDTKSDGQEWLRYLLMDWGDQKITVKEKEASTKTPSGKTLDQLEYFNKDYMTVILTAEGDNYFEGVTKADKDFYHLVIDLVWMEEGWASLEKENRWAHEDYVVVSVLGEKADRFLQNKTYQYKMPVADVVEFYKDVMGVEREYAPEHDTSTEVGVLLRDDDLYGYNGVGWGDYGEISKIEDNGKEIVLHATIKSTFTLNSLAEVKVNLERNDGRFGYVLKGSEVAQDMGMDPESGQELQEFEAGDLRIQYVTKRYEFADAFFPVIRNLVYMGNDTAKFTANAKRILPELKKAYENDPGSDGSNVAAKSTLLASYDFANNSKILIYEDAVYGKVPPATGDGSEYGYYLNYCILTPGNLYESGEIFSYKESFGDMPEHREGVSLCRHLFLGQMYDKPAIAPHEYVLDTADFAKERLFYAKVGRNHEMTVDEDGWEKYDADLFTYDAYFYPDGTRVLTIYDTWQIATGDYVSHGAFLKDANGKTVFEQKVTPEGFEYYVEGQKLTIEQKSRDREETAFDVALDQTTKLVGRISSWGYEGIFSIDLVYSVDGTEAHLNLFSFRLAW